MNVPPAPPGLVADALAFAEVVARLKDAPRYALDTEFHREKTYWPQVALVQVAWPAEAGGGAGGGARGEAGTALVDPLAVDLSPLAEILEGPATMVAHAAEQDLEVLLRSCGTVPAHLFDTQVAAGFAGHGSASLASLSASYLGISVAKGDRLTDWSARPLADSQLRYAAADVDHLLELATAIGADLEARGRLDWADQECELVRSKATGEPDPARAWWKLRDARALRGSERGVAQELAAWRESQAKSRDIPVRHVLPDLALQSIAHRPPSSRQALAAVRGLDGRYLRGDSADEILAAVGRGLHLPDAAVNAPQADEVPKDLRPAVALAMAWVAQLARDAAVDAALLATRSDVVAMLRNEPDARLGRGWRADVAGDTVGRLLGGRAALAFDRGQGLVIEARSGRPPADREGK